MATLTRNTIVVGGLDLAGNLVAADTLGDEVLNSVATTTRTFIAVANGSGGPITVTINSQVNCSQGFDHDSAVVVAAGDTSLIGPLPKARWNDTADQKVKWTYSAVASVTVGVFDLP
jgi:hypothetical protein